jgi:hypothetical protein
MTDNADLAGVLKDTCEVWRKRQVYWKVTTKYFDGTSDNPAWTNSESSKG